MKIVKIFAHEILDSRGIPTVACKLDLDSGKQVLASVPSGSSCGKYEAQELRDGDKSRFSGNGVLTAIKHVNENIAKVVIGQKPHLLRLDKEIIALDGTDNKSKLGANATLAVSIAIAKAQAIASNQELYANLAELYGTHKPAMPRMLFNLINGGVHASNNLSVQEFMVVPTSDKPTLEVLEDVSLIYQMLQELLQNAGYKTGTGVEGGFSPRLSGEREALDFLMQAIESSGFCSDDYALALDVAASGLYDEEAKLYTLQGKTYSNTALVQYYEELVSSYPILSIEDGLSQDDESGWSQLTARLGERVQIVGDDG